MKEFREFIILKLFWPFLRESWRPTYEKENREEDRDGHFPHIFWNAEKSKQWFISDKMVATLINVTLNIVLAIAGLMLFTLLVPVPRAIVRMTTGIISLLKGEQVVWVSRLLFLVLVAMVVGTYPTIPNSFLLTQKDPTWLFKNMKIEKTLLINSEDKRPFKTNLDLKETFTSTILPSLLFCKFFRFPKSSLTFLRTVWRVQHIFEYKDKLQSDVSELRKKIAAK